MVYIKSNKGVTLIVLVCTVIILLILAGVSLTEGNKIMTKTNLDTQLTNMITIRAKAKVYAEEINAEIWDEQDKEAKRQTLYSEKYKMEIINASEITSKIDGQITATEWDCYEITTETLDEMDLEGLKEGYNNGDYVVVYDSEDYTNLDVVYTKGVEDDGYTYYTLSALQKQFE